MMKMVYNDKLVYKVVIWVFFGIRLWTEKEALMSWCMIYCDVMWYTVWFCDILWYVIYYNVIW